MSSWQSLLARNALDGWMSGGPCFKRDGEVITGEDSGCGDRLMTGDPGWTDYEVEAAVTVHKGPLAQLHYRISNGDRSWYTLDLKVNEQVVTLSHADNRPGGAGFSPVVITPVKLEYGKEYRLRVVCSGATAKGYVDECPVGAIGDMKYPSGPIGLGLYACRASFRNPRIKLP